MIFNIMLQAVIYCCKGFFFLHLDVGLLIKIKKKKITLQRVTDMGLMWDDLA